LHSHTNKPTVPSVPNARDPSNPNAADYAETSYVALLRERDPSSRDHIPGHTAIVGSNPTEAWMFVCVLCAFFLFLHSLK
jgi:hypothetical protein